MLRRAWSKCVLPYEQLPYVILPERKAVHIHNPPSIIPRRDLRRSQTKGESVSFQFHIRCTGTYHNRSPEVDMEIAQDEISRAHHLAPEIVPATPPEESLIYIVGIRPSREGGFRLDSERVGNRVILSAYGFGGGGYAFSYGIADALVRMVENEEREHVIL